MILGLIPARAGSKRIENKNIYEVCGKPLIEYTIEAASKSMLLDTYIISTDMPEVLSRYPSAVERPEALCTDDSPTIDLLRYIFSEYDCSHICLLQPTSPLRTHVDIDSAIAECMLQDKDSLYSGYKMVLKTKDKTHDRHRDSLHFQRNGAIFIMSRELVEQGKLWDNDVIEYEMSENRSRDIDTYDDLFAVEALLKNGVLYTI